MIGFSSESMAFRDEFCARLADKMLIVAEEVALLREQTLIEPHDLRHILRHAFERALREDE